MVSSSDIISLWNQRWAARTRCGDIGVAMVHEAQHADGGASQITRKWRKPRSAHGRAKQCTTCIECAKEARHDREGCARY